MSSVGAAAPEPVGGLDLYSWSPPAGRPLIAEADFVEVDGVHLGARRISVTIEDAQLIHGPEGLRCFDLASGAREPLPAPLSHCEDGSTIFADWKDAPEPPTGDGAEPPVPANEQRPGARPSAN